MLKPRKLDIRCGDSKCEADLHCFRPTKLNHSSKPVCRDCGVDLVDWDRLRERRINDVTHTFRTLQMEFIRHEFWHIRLNEKVRSNVLRKGVDGVKEWAKRHLKSNLRHNNPWDGRQTSMIAPEDATSIFPYAQHATATCCRKCAAYWHGIPRHAALTEQDLDYLSELIVLYVKKRVPELENGERPEQ